MTSANSVTYRSVIHHNVPLHRGVVIHRCLPVLVRRDFSNPGTYGPDYGGEHRFCVEAADFGSSHRPRCLEYRGGVMTRPLSIGVLSVQLNVQELLALCGRRAEYLHPRPSTLVGRGSVPIAVPIRKHLRNHGRDEGG